MKPRLRLPTNNEELKPCFTARWPISIFSIFLCPETQKKEDLERKVQIFQFPFALTHLIGGCHRCLKSLDKNLTIVWSRYIWLESGHTLFTNKPTLLSVFLPTKRRHALEDYILPEYCEENSSSNCIANFRPIDEKQNISLSARRQPASSKVFLKAHSQRFRWPGSNPRSLTALQERMYMI